MKKILQFVTKQQRNSATSEELQKILKERCKEAALKLGVELLEQEVIELCGASYSRKTEDQYYRGGSESTSIVVDGGKLPIRRPRVRNDQGEVDLEVLKKLQDQDLLDEEMKHRMLKGISTRNLEPVSKMFYLGFQ